MFLVIIQRCFSLTMRAVVCLQTSNVDLFDPKDQVLVVCTNVSRVGWCYTLLHNIKYKTDFDSMRQK
jgi:hypothetical protein